MATIEKSSPISEKRTAALEASLRLALNEDHANDNHKESGLNRDAFRNSGHDRLYHQLSRQPKTSSPTKEFMRQKLEHAQRVLEGITTEQFEPPVLPEWGYVHQTIRDAKLRHTAEERLPQFVGECGIDPGVVRSAKVRKGEPESQICRSAVEENTDLIVMASHGLGGLKHPFIGSTSAGVVRHAPCPVLTVRERALGTDQHRAPYW
jgi:hypothetical protein